MAIRIVTMPKNPEIVTTASETVGERVRAIRRTRQLTVEDLAAMCADAGYPELTRDAIYAIESGRRLGGRRRRTVSIDELFGFAKAFNVPLAVLLWPILQPSSGRESTLVFDSPEERDGFMQVVAKLMTRAYGPPADQEGPSE